MSFARGYELGMAMDRDTDAAALRYHAAHAPDMPKEEKSGWSRVFDIFKGEPPPDQPNQGIPASDEPDAPAVRTTADEWREWEQKMLKFSGARKPEDIAQVHEQIGAYKQQRFNQRWAQAMNAADQGRGEEAARLMTEAYDYFTNGQGTSIQFDPQTGMYLSQPYHEKTKIAGKPHTFSIEEAMTVPGQLGPAAFGRGLEAQADFGKEQRARELHPGALRKQEADIGYTGALTGEAGARTDRLQTMTPILEEQGRQKIEESQYRLDELAEVTGALQQLRTELDEVADEARFRELYGIGPEEDITTLQEEARANIIETWMMKYKPESVGKKLMELEAASLKTQQEAIKRGKTSQKDFNSYVDNVYQALEAFTDEQVASATDEPALQNLYKADAGTKRRLSELGGHVMKYNNETFGRPVGANEIVDLIETLMVNPKAMEVLNEAGYGYPAGVTVVKHPDTQRAVALDPTVGQSIIDLQNAAIQTAEAETAARRAPDMAAAAGETVTDTAIPLAP